MPGFVLLLFPPCTFWCWLLWHGGGGGGCCALGIKYFLQPGPFWYFWMKVKPGRSAWEWCMIPELLCDLLTGAARSSCACWLCVLAGLQIVVKVKVLRALGRRRICLLYIHPGSPPHPLSNRWLFLLSLSLGSVEGVRCLGITDQPWVLRINNQKV